MARSTTCESKWNVHPDAATSRTDVLTPCSVGIAPQCGHCALVLGYGTAHPAQNVSPDVVRWFFFTAIRDQEHQLLRPDADAVAIFERGAADQRPSVELRPVATVQVLERRLRPREVDSYVSARQHRIVDRHLAHRASANDDFVAGQVDLL